MGKRKTSYSVETVEVIDHQTGEVFRTENKKKHRIFTSQDEFYMTYIDFVAPLYQLTNSTTKSILSWMCSNAEFNTGKISLSQAKRLKMQEDLNIKNTSAISGALKALKEKKIISGERGDYQINPQMFWKGDLETRDRFLQTKEFEITFSVPGTESGNFEDIQPNTEFDNELSDNTTD